MHSLKPGKIAVLSLALAALAMSAAFTSSLMAARMDFGRLYLTYSHLQLDMGDFNSRLFDRNLIDLEDTFNTLGGGFYTLVGSRWTVGGDVQVMLENSRRVGVHSTTVSGGFGDLKLGWLAYSNGGFHAHPRLGVGLGTVDMEITALGEPDPTSPLGGDRGMLEMSSFQTTVTLDAAFDYMLPLSQADDGSVRGLVMGVSLGYRLSPWQGAWDDTGIDIFDDPGIKLQGPTIRLSVGYGWSGR